jgi:hypothetical protein
VAAKGVDAFVIVGSDGRSVRVEPERAVLAVMLYHPGSVYDVRPTLATPRGGYVRVYPLGSGGFPAIPGRFYPANRALCFSWSQGQVSGSCGRLGPPRRLLAASRRLALFHRRATVLARLDPPATLNLLVALQLAFDRYRAARSARPPASCLPFVADWAGPQAQNRPARLCISRRGIYARGRLYPAAPATWSLARDVARRAKLDYQQSS